MEINNLYHLGMVGNTGSIDNMFLKSALTKESDLNTTDFILKWVNERKSNVKFSIEKISLNYLNNWIVDIVSNNITHKSGKFFSIEGVTVETNYGYKGCWDQPIINQPEMGFLGMLTKNIKGVLHFLIQAKIEPGNLNVVQLSPTLQATKSNYTCVHNGKKPLYLEYFNGEKNVEILIDQIQSEQGARFLHKRNRNIIVKIKDDEYIRVSDNFIWVTLGQLKELMKYDNLVNMDTRTVISSISFDNDKNFNLLISETSPRKTYYSLIQDKEPLHNLNYLISWITNLKFKYELNVSSKNIKDIKDWFYNGESISHKDNKYFSVIGVNVNIDNREVINWDQPMIKPSQDGVIGLIIKKINGVYHFLVQAKVEIGNLDILELAPTVQCLTGNYRTGLNEYSVPFIGYILNAKEEQIWHKSYQSEEGGRFFQEQNLNMIVEVDDKFNEELPENYCWMTLNQLNMFMKFNNYLNIGLRSLLSLIKF